MKILYPRQRLFLSQFDATNLTKSDVASNVKKYGLTYNKVWINDEVFSPVRLDRVRYERRLEMLALR
jgi:hypothetical protein